MVSAKENHTSRSLTGRSNCETALRLQPRGSLCGILEFTLLAFLPDGQLKFNLRHRTSIEPEGTCSLLVHEAGIISPCTHVKPLSRKVGLLGSVKTLSIFHSHGLRFLCFSAPAVRNMKTRILGGTVGTVTANILNPGHFVRVPLNQLLWLWERMRVLAIAVGAASPEATIAVEPRGPRAQDAAYLMYLGYTPAIPINLHVLSCRIA